MIGSTPTFSEFDPRAIPMQLQVLKDIRTFDYSLGTHEILLSGSVGSSKSILMAHILARHCLENKKAGAMIGRRALPDLKDTLYKKIIEHLQGLPPNSFKDYDSTARVDFRNGSSIIARSWADKHYTKMRSLDLSIAAFEELAENKGDDATAYHEGTYRLGRLPHIKNPLIISATNPDAPDHWVYKHFIEPNSGGKKHPTRHVYYSRTEDNPFLPRSYIEQLKRDLDPRMARRMLYGEWLEISGEVVYYEYNKDHNYRTSTFKPNPEYPVLLSWDFNIGEGKPMSCCAMQQIGGEFHIFAEVIIDGGRTADTVDELLDRGIVKEGFEYHIHGDASGKARDTRSNRSDYDIIAQKLNHAGIKYVMKVPLANPPVRSRHNTVNAHFKNSFSEHRLFVWNCPTVDEGFRLTKLKRGSSYIEDDSLRSQHVTTAVGYCIMRVLKDKSQDARSVTL